MEPDPGSRAYWNDEYKLWLPGGQQKRADPSQRPGPEPPPSSRRHFPVAHLVALAVTAVLVVLILVFLDDLVPKPLVELIALVPILFFDLIARTIERRKLEWPTVTRSVLGPRPWYISGVGYAALLLIAAEAAGALLQGVGGTVTLLGFLNIVIGVAMGVLIALRFEPRGRPLLTILETALLASVLGGLFDLILVGRERFSEVHGGAALIVVVIVNGLVWTVTGITGYLGMTALRRLRPPRLLLSPDRRHVWDGSAWYPVEPNGRSYHKGGKRIAFRGDINPPSTKHFPPS
jgi:hypothetical protein